MICGSVIVLQGKKREGSVAVGKERDKEIGILWTKRKKKRCKVLTAVPAVIYEYGRLSVMEFPCFLRRFMVAILPII
jgi:hypothetical protein